MEYNKVKKLINDILYKKWNPIRIEDETVAKTEYTSYIPRIINKIKQNPSKKELVLFLKRIEEDEMEISRNISKLESAVECLLDEELVGKIIE